MDAEHGVSLPGEEIPPQIRAAQELVAQFNERLAAAVCCLLDIGIPLQTVLDTLTEHQAKALALAEPREERKRLREHCVAFFTERLIVAELRRLNAAGGSPGPGSA